MGISLRTFPLIIDHPFDLSKQRAVKCQLVLWNKYCNNKNKYYNNYTLDSIDSYIDRAVLSQKGSYTTLQSGGCPWSKIPVDFPFYYLARASWSY